MDNFLNSGIRRSFVLLERKLSEFFSLLALLHMLVTDNRPVSLNTNGMVSSVKGDASQLELDKLHELADRTEQELQAAMDSNLDRNDQLNILLDRSDVLLHKNQAFGVGVMDYRKDMERKQTLRNLKYVAVGVLLLTVIILGVTLNVILNHTNTLASRSTSIVLE